MAGALAQEWWKVRFRDRVLEAHGRVTMVVWKIGNARGSLAPPVLAPATDTVRSRIRRAGKALEAASSDLYAAASLLRSAEELALRGGTFAPWDPQPRVRDIHVTSATQRSAARKLREARVFAIEACYGVEKVLVFLESLRLLLNHPLLPGVDGYLRAERRNALDLIKGLKDAADGCVSMVRSVRDNLPPSDASYVCHQDQVDS